MTNVAATAPAAGFTITGSPITTTGTFVFALANDLSGLENLATTGVAVRTGTSTWTTRTITAGTGISITNGNGVSGNPTITSTVAAGITTANNGLTLTGANVQWGGALVQNTTIDGQTFYQLHKDGRVVTQRYESNPVTAVNVTSAVDWTGIAANPISVITPGEDAVTTVRGYTNGSSTYSGNALFTGIYTTAINGVWMQARNEGAYTTSYPISINPRGGKVSTGRLHNADLPDAIFTIASAGLTGTTVVGSLLQLENSEGSGNAYMTWGNGNDANDMGLGWFDASVSTRLYNVSTTTGSLIQIGFTQATPTELVIQRNASGTSNVGIGHGTFSDIDSRLQINGSIGLASLISSATTLTLDDTHFHVVCTAGSAISYTIPVATTCIGRVYWIDNNSNFTITLSENVTRGLGVFTTITSFQTGYIQATASGWYGFKIASL